MPNRRNNRNRPRRRARHSNGATLPVLNKILTSLEQQQNSQQPERPDIAIRSKPKRPRIYPFTQAYIGPVISTVSTGETDFSLIFTLNLLTNVSAFVNLFEFYRVRQIRVSFNPVAGTQINVSLPSCLIYTAIDNFLPGAVAISNLLSYDNLKVSPVGSFFERTFTPHCQGLSTTNAGSNPAVLMPSSTWIDTPNQLVEFFGLKISVSAGGAATATPLWSTIVTVDLEFRQPL